MKMKRILLLAASLLLLGACKKQGAETPAWRDMPKAKSISGELSDGVIALSGTNRCLLMGQKLALPKYAAFYSEPGQDPKSIVPIIIAIGEKQYFSGSMYADTNKVGSFKTPSFFLGTCISKHNYFSRSAFAPMKLPHEVANITLWGNQSAIREANLRRWNDILSYHDDAYRERMAKANRTTNLQTDEVWDDDVDLTVRIRYIMEGYTYMFYNSGNTAKSPEEVEPVDVFKKLTAEIETRENPTNKDLRDVMLYFSYDGGPRYYMYKRDYDLEACYWRQAEHVTLQNDPSKVSVSLMLKHNGSLIDSRYLPLSDFVANYFPYATFTNWVTGVSVKAPPEGSVLKIIVDGGPLYGPIEAEKEIK
jgi:hypothetical protein